MTPATVPEFEDRRWRLVGFAVVFLLGVAATVAPASAAVGGIESGVEVANLVAAVGEVALLWTVAIHLRDDRFQPSDVLLVALWTVTIALVGLAVAGAVVLFQEAAGGVIVDMLLLLNHLSLIGGVVGALVGSYDAESRVRRRALDRERERLSDRSARLNLLNRLLRHDIRNDANVIQGYAGLLAERLDDDHGELTRIRSTADHVDELTQVAGDLAAASEMPVESVRLADPVTEAVETVRDAYPEAEIRCEGVPPDVTVRGNSLLSSVVANLVRNGIQHNDSDEPTVTVSVETTADRATVVVADDGPGIDEAVRDELFSAGEAGRDSDGLGLGLHLVETVVENLGGDVSVCPNEPTGVVFRVSLPKARS